MLLIFSRSRQLLAIIAVLNFIFRINGLIDNIVTYNERIGSKLMSNKDNELLLICRYGEYCHADSECSPRNKCHIADQKYSYCIPDDDTLLAVDAEKCVDEGDICVNATECCHVGSSCTLDFTMHNIHNNTGATIKRCRRFFPSRCVYPTSRAAFLKGVEVPTTLENFRTISIRINGILGGCSALLGSNNVQNKLTIVYAFAELHAIDSSNVAYSSCQDEVTNEILVHFQCDKSVELRYTGDVEEATRKLRGLARLFQTLTFFHAAVTAVNNGESAAPRLLLGLPTNSLICQFGGFCMKDSDCVIGNSCFFASNAYSQCLPNYSVYKTTGCVTNYSPSCDDSTVCCDPGAYCSSGPYRQCIQPNVPDCILPTSYKPSPLPSRAPSAVSTALPTLKPNAFPTPRPSAKASKIPSPLLTRLPTCKVSIPPTEYPTLTPIDNPSEEPSANPTIVPSPKSTRVPSKSPSRLPTLLPSIKSTNLPTRQPSLIPSTSWTKKPSLRPSKSPSVLSTIAPSEEPSTEPTSLFTELPTAIPTYSPTRFPSKRPSYKPSIRPTSVPTIIPTASPSKIPTKTPTRRPTAAPKHLPTQNPTITPSEEPTIEPTVYPSEIPTGIPSSIPSRNPSKRPSYKPSNRPTSVPTVIPTAFPSRIPTKAPTCRPTVAPKRSPTQNPTTTPSEEPTTEPTGYPSEFPTSISSSIPSKKPTKRPSYKPSIRPTSVPTIIPTASSTRIPTKAPTCRPTAAPKHSPTQNPTITPSEEPTIEPTCYPSELPTVIPSSSASRIPKKTPTRRPTISPIPLPTISLTNNPSIEPRLALVDSRTKEPSTSSCVPIDIPTKYSLSKPSLQDNSSNSVTRQPINDGTYSTSTPSTSSISIRSGAPNPSNRTPGLTSPSQFAPIPIPSSASSNATLSFHSLLVLTNFSTDIKSLGFNARVAVTDTYSLVLGLSKNSTLYEMDHLDQTTVVTTHKAVIQVEDRGDSQPDIYIYLRVVTLLGNYPKYLRDSATLYHALHSNLTASFRSGNFLGVLRHQFHIQNESSFYYVTVVNISDVFGQLNSVPSAPSVAPFGILQQTSQIYSEMIIMTSSVLMIAAFILTAIIVYKIARATTVRPPQQTVPTDNSSIATSEGETCQDSDVCSSKAGGLSEYSTVASAMLSISGQEEMKRSSMHSLDPPSFDSFSTEGDPFNRKNRFRESSSVHGNSIYFRNSSLPSRVSDEDVGYNFDNHQLVLDFGKLRSEISAESFEGDPSASDITASGTASETVIMQKRASSSLSSSAYSTTKGRSTTIDVGNVYSIDSQIG